MARFAWLVCVMGLLASHPLFAQNRADTYPSKTVRMIVGLAPGGNPDTFARVTAKALSEHFGQQFVVENRPGAGSNVAAEAVVKSPPDGHTLLVGASGIFTINPHVYRDMAFDPFKDLTPITNSVATTMWLVVHPSVPATNVRELLAYAKAQPKPLAYASSGNGSIHHITMETFKQMAGVDFVHVPFKGAGQSVPALLANDVQVAFIGYPTIASAVKAGRLRVLAFSMGRRSSLTPDVPTVAESGVPGFDMAGSTGVYAPSATPKAIIVKLNQAFNDALKNPEVSKAITNAGMEPLGTTPEQFEKQLRAESERDAAMVKRLGLRGE